VIAAACTASSGFALAVGHFVTTTTFDLLGTTVVCWLMIRAVRRRSGPELLAAGVVTGLGFEGKPQVVSPHGQHENNVIEADHGRLKARLRPMRGLKHLSSAGTVTAGHALIQNLRRGHCQPTADVPTAPPGPCRARRTCPQSLNAPTAESGRRTLRHRLTQQCRLEAPGSAHRTYAHIGVLIVLLLVITLAATIATTEGGVYSPASARW
jgi:DDE domain/Dolichyl-phosphate-mannose-protein mannosyltransferase